jgi:hypothetical protein
MPSLSVLWQSLSWVNLEVKNMIRPGLQVEANSPLEQLIPFADIAGGAERVFEPDRWMKNLGHFFLPG